jgi:hypothetical protein
MQTITFSLAGGGDSHRFRITSGGLLSFELPPDFESPTDANGDNVYQVVVRADDGQGASATRSIDVTVTAVNDNGPVFTTPDALSVAENTADVLTVVASDADRPPQALTFSIVGGEDQSQFNITQGGALAFNFPPDFEVPADSNGDNIYIVVVQVSDGSLTNLQALLVNVTNVFSEPLLPGDYNNNGTVDTADYVLWRNGGPLQNEVDTPGTVTQADYDVWRANFGRTISAASHSDATRQIAETATSQGIELPRFDQFPDRIRVRLPALPVDELDRSTRARSIGHRPDRRDGVTVVTSRDAALVAWLAARPVNHQRDLATDSFGDDLRVPFARDNPQPAIAALDTAFATL